MKHWLQLGSGKPWLHCLLILALTTPITAIRAQTSSGFSPELVWFRSILEPASIAHSGNLLAVPSRQGTVSIYRVSDGALLVVIPAHDSRVSAVAFSSDGRRLATGSDDRAVKVWEVSADGRNVRLLYTLREHTSWINALAFSPDGTALASASHDQTIRVWSLSDGTRRLVLTGHTGSVTSVAFSPDGQTVASGSEDRTVQLWDVNNGTVVRTFSGHDFAVRSVAFSPDGTQIASGSDDKTVRLWSVSAGSLLRTFAGHTGSVTSVAFAPDGQRIASGSEDRTVQLWDVNNGTLVRTFVGHDFAVRCVAFSPDGTQIASGSEDKSVRIWLVSTGATVRIFSEHTNDVTATAVAPDNVQVASASKDGTVILRQLTTGVVETTIVPAHNNWVTCLAYSDDGNWIASGGRDQTVRVWNARTGALVLGPLNHGGWVYAVALSPDGSLLASAGENGIIRLWATTSGTPVAQIDADFPVWSLAFSRDNTLLAAALDNGQVRTYRVSNQDEVQRINAHTGRAYAVAFSRAGNVLASAGQDGVIRLWNATDWSRRGELVGHVGPVYSVAFSRDGAFVISGGEDNTVRYWSVETLAPLKVLRGHATAVKSVALSGDGLYAASASEDGLALWRVREAPYNVPPSVPEIIQPDNGVVVSPTPTFVLRAEDANGDQVRFVIELTQGETTQTLQTGLVDSGRRLSFTVPNALTSGEWRYRVKAVDAKGSEGEWSANRTLIANRSPLSAEVLEPANGSVVSPTPTFVLRAQDEESDQVRFVIELVQGDNTLTLQTDPVDSGRRLSFTVPNALTSGEWSYRVKAVDAKGSEGEWSATRTLIANRSPLSAEVLEPANGSVVSPTPTFVLRAQDEESDQVRFVIELVQGDTTLTLQTELVDSGRRLSYTVPNALTSGEWRYRVKAVDAKGSESSHTSGVVNVADEVISTIPAGLSSWGIGINIGNKTKADLGLAGVPIRVWDATAQQYREVGNAEPLLPGRGYWVKPSSVARLIMSGVPNASPFSIRLKAGWNHIANPFLVPLQWDLSAIRVRRNGEERSLEEASRIGWIASYAWAWDNGQQRYVLVSAPGYVSGAQTQIAPWQSCWVYAYQDCDLILARSRGTDTAVGRSLQQTPGPWSIRLQVQLGAHWTGVVVGGSRLSQDVAVGLPPDPPVSNPVPKMYLLRQGVPVAVDLRADGRANTAWDIVMEVPEGNASETATLLWQGAHLVPRGVNPVLVDLQTGERKFLRTTSSHQFAISRQGGVYRFRLEMLPNAQLLRITQARVYGGRSVGGRFSIVYQISDAAQVEVTITSGGRLIRRLASGITRSAGLQQMTWDGRDQNGVAVPAGAYMVEIRASNSDGQTVRATVPVVVTR
jgi:WD40 repeat protein